MSSKEVLRERAGAVLVVTINRPDARNALNRNVAEGIAAAADELDASDDLRAGVLTEPAELLRRDGPQGLPPGRVPSLEGRGLCGITMTPPRKPMVAAVEGWALAGDSNSCWPATWWSRARPRGSASPR
ncbi:hypothetical protein ACR6C2_01595 [Streptomyces sp. INA 01156]